MQRLFKAFFLLIILSIIPYSFGLPLDQTSIREGIEDPKWQQMLLKGSKLAVSGQSREAIAIFEKVSQHYESLYRDSNDIIMSASSQAEMMRYLTDAAKKNKDNPSSHPKNTVVIASTWGYAYYLKGYALIDLKEYSQAKLLIERAIQLSPYNSQFLSEMGHIYQIEKNWEMALKYYRSAEKAAIFSPNDINKQLTRALRGVGYVYIEQNKLEEAEKIYNECLKINPKDTIALSELAYIKELREKKK